MNVTEVLVWLLVAAHLVCVNLSTAAPLICIWLDSREARGDRLAGDVGRSLLGIAVAALLPGILLGLLAGWMLWPVGLAQAVRRLPSKVNYGIVEMVFSWVLLACVWFWWRRPRRAGSLGVWGRGTLSVLAATNLMYHFPVLFAILTDLIHGGDFAAAAIDSAEFRQRLAAGSVLARATHAAVASFAVSGLALSLLAARTSREPATSGTLLVVAGARIALTATLLQLPIGFWVLMRISEFAQGRLMGSDLLATALFGAGLALALWLAHVLAALSSGTPAPGRVYWAAILLLAVIMLMTAASRRAFAPARPFAPPTSSASFRIIPCEVVHGQSTACG